MGDPEVGCCWRKEVLGTSLDFCWSCALILLQISLFSHLIHLMQGSFTCWITFSTGTCALPSFCFFTSLQVNEKLIVPSLHFPGLPDDCVLWWAWCQQHLQVWGYLSKSQAGKQHSSWQSLYPVVSQVCPTLICQLTFFTFLSFVPPFPLLLLFQCPGIAHVSCASLNTQFLEIDWLEITLFYHWEPNGNASSTVLDACEEMPGIKLVASCLHARLLPRAL